jgi:hypothetical protein
MSILALILSILILVAIGYVVRLIARARGMSRATKILLPTSVLVSVMGVVLLFTEYGGMGGALIGLAGAMTLLEGRLRHKAERISSK